MLWCIVIMPCVFKEKASCKAVSPPFLNLIHLYGYQLEHHPRDDIQNTLPLF